MKVIYHCMRAEDKPQLGNKTVERLQVTRRHVVVGRRFYCLILLFVTLHKYVDNYSNKLDCRKKMNYSSNCTCQGCDNIFNDTKYLSDNVTRGFVIVMLI